MKNTVLSGCLLGGMLVFSGCQSDDKKPAEETPQPRAAVQKTVPPKPAPRKVRKKESKQSGFLRRSSMPPSGLTDRLTPAEQAALSAQRQENAGSVSASFKKNNEESDKRNSGWVFGR